MSESKAENKNEKEVDLEKEIKNQKEWHKTMIYGADGKVRASTFGPNEVTEDELKVLLNAFSDRDKTVGQGVMIGGLHFEVHRFHDKENLIYGRRGQPAETIGFAIYRIVQKKSSRVFYYTITYVSPTLSARAIPQLRNFAAKYIDVL